MNSIKTLDSSAPSIRPIKPTRGTDKMAPRRSSAPFGSITKRTEGDEDEANDAVFVRRGRCEYMIENWSECGAKTIASGLELEFSDGLLVGAFISGALSELGT